MNYKTATQIILLIIIILLTSMFYWKYVNINGSKENINQVSELNSKIDENSNIDTLKEIYYESYDQNGNKFIIESEFGNFQDEDQQIILMTNVNAVIELKDSNNIYLVSNMAKYNILNNNTNFYTKVELIYLDNQVNCENLDISFDNNEIEAYNDLIYKNSNTTLLADKVMINFVTKDSKIYMMDESNVKIMVNN